MTAKQRRCAVKLECRGNLATWWFSSPIKRVTDLAFFPMVIHYTLKFVSIAERKPKHSAPCCDKCKAAIQAREQAERNG